MLQTLRDNKCQCRKTFSHKRWRKYKKLYDKVTNAATMEANNNTEINKLPIYLNSKGPSSTVKKKKKKLQDKIYLKTGSILLHSRNPTENHGYTSPQDKRNEKDIPTKCK